MPESPMVGARVPQEWQQQISAIAAAAGRKEAEVVREALAQYLGQTDPAAVKGAIALLFVISSTISAVFLIIVLSFLPDRVISNRKSFHSNRSG